MKKGLLAIILTIFLATSLVSALDLSLSKTSYYPGETLQLVVPDVFIDNLQKTNVGLYSIGGVHKIPAEVGVLKSQNQYYLYLVLPQTVGNYALKIENLRYYDNNIQSSETISKNFSIANTNESYLSFTPGQILTSNDFSILVKAYNAPTNVNVNFEATGFSQSFNLGYGATKTVYIPASSINEFIVSSIKLNDYSIPVIISPVVKNISLNQSLAQIDSPIEDLVEILPNQINATILSGLTYYFEILLNNKISQSIGNLNLTSPSSEIGIYPNFTDLYGDKKRINITIKSNADLDSIINLSYGNSSMSIPVIIRVTKNESNITSNIPILNLQKSCTSIGGIVCNSSAGQSCSGSEADSIDGACCLTECKVQGTSSTWIWGVVILVLLGFGGWFLYKKSQEKPSEERANQLLRRQSEDYEKRVAPEPVQVKKSLERD